MSGLFSLGGGEMVDILHLTHTDIRTDSRILKELRALSKEGLSVRAVGVCLEEGAKHSEINFPIDVVQINLRSRRLRILPRTIRHIFSLFELSFKMLRFSFARGTKVIHCHDTMVLPLGAILKILTGAKLVYDAHELESDRNGISRVQSWLTLSVERFLWGLVDCLIVVSPSIEKWYHANIGAKPSIVILNAPLFDALPRVSGNYLRDTFEIPLDEKVFVYVGIVGRGRGVELICEAFAQEKIRAHVVFVGFGELVEKVKLAASRCENIHWHKAVSHDNVVPIIQSADYGLCLVERVSLSDFYCLPNKLFEYAFAGLPVLASDFPDIRSLVREYDLGVCFEPDQSGLIKVIQELQEAQVRVLTSDLRPLSWQTQEQKLLEVYRSVVSVEK